MLSTRELQKAETLRQMGYTPDQVLEVLRPNKTPDEQSVAQETFADVKDTWANIKKTAFDGLRGIKETGKDLLSGEIQAPRAAFQYAGQSLGTATGAVSDAVVGLGKTLLPQGAEDAISGVAQKVLPTEQVKDASLYFETLDPTVQRDLKALGGFFDAATFATGGGAAFSTGKNVARKTAVKTALVTDGVKTTAKNSAKSLRDVFNLDSAVVGAAKVGEGVKKIPEKVAEKVSKSIDNKNIELAKTAPKEAESKIIDLYKTGVVPGVKGKNKNIRTVKSTEGAVVRNVKELSKKYDIQNLEDFAGSINAELKKIWSKTEKTLGKATSDGVQVSLEPVVKRLDEVLASDRAKFNSKIRKSVEKLKAEYVDEAGNAVKINPTSLQDVIADLNKELDSFYRTGANPAENIITAGVVQDMNKLLDESLASIKSSKIAPLKKRYADLKKIEKDVVHRAIFEAQKGAGLGQYADIFAAGDILGGVVGGNAAFTAKGIGTYLVKDVLKALGNKDEIIRQMFVIGKELN